ncbi:MAG: hypothetical protein M3121_02630 [Chloroflexota bacterium]|nr:hypothetical protein [Chloroflexota bacterium]
MSSNKPITPATHGLIDYGLLGLMLSAPSLLGLKGSAKTLPYLFGGIEGALNAVTNHPFALKRLVPFRTHGQIELSSMPLMIALPAVTGAFSQPKARAFFLGTVAMLATVYVLTDWDA